MTAVQSTPIDGTFGRLHRGLTSSENVGWKEPKARPVRRLSQTLKKVNLNQFKNELIMILYIPFTKITAGQKEVALSYHQVRGLHFLTVIIAVTLSL